MAQNFSWDHPDLDEHAFIAFAALLRLRAGGVPIMQSSSDGSTLTTNMIEGNEEDDDEDEDDEDGGKAASIHTDRNDRLHDVPYTEKAEFLDSIAKLAANKKGKQAVAASAMWEREEDVIIWVAKNRGFQKEEERFFSQIAQLLSGIAAASKNGRHTSTSSRNASTDLRDTEASNLKNQLWHAMLGHYRSRLNTYIENLMEHFSGLDPMDGQDPNGTFDSGQSLPDTLQKIKDLCTLYRRSDNSDSCLERLVFAANKARGSIVSRDSAIQVSTPLRKVWTDIRFLGWLRIGYTHFITIATGFACFGKVCIHCLSKKNFLDSRVLEPLSMAKTFGLLSEDAEVAASLASFQTNNIIDRKRKQEAKRKRNAIGIGKVKGKGQGQGSNRKWECTKETLERDFATLQVESKICHAELQILLHLAVQDTTDNVYQYIGCSKYSCWLCWNFLDVFSQLRTRGCHQKMYHNWRIPEIGPLNTQSSDRIINTLVQLQGRLKRSLLEETEKGVDAQAESLAGKTIYSDHASLPSRLNNPSISQYVFL
jgi:OTT_1508-like deaminase